MGVYLFKRDTGIYEGCGSRRRPPDGYVQLELAEIPDRRRQRWDRAGGVRPATAEEIAAYDAWRAERRTRWARQAEAAP